MLIAIKARPFHREVGFENGLALANPTPPSATLTARASYHHGNLRDALVLRGIEILDTQGFDALSLGQAACDVGVSQAAPLHHFDGKVGYLAAIATQGFRLMFETRIRALRELQDRASGCSA